MSETGPERYLCLKCSQWFDAAPALTACPGCGDSRGVPANSRDVVTVSITWHELRILVMWAERWAQHVEREEPGTGEKVLYGIADRIRQQHLDKPPLTFMEELTQLREHYPDVEVHGFKEPEL